MEQNIQKTVSSDKSNYWNWLLWWRIGKEELKQQLEGYDSLKIYQSARGISLIALLFSAAVTLIFIVGGMSEPASLFDVILFTTFGFFIFKGQRWAAVAAMVLWSIEKLLSLTSGSTNVIMIIVWWASYMHVFYLSYKVEVMRGLSTRHRVSSTEADSKVFCTVCGTSIDSDSKFCFKCGAKVK